MKKGMRIFILFLLSLCIYGQTLQTMPVYAATGKKIVATKKASISKRKKTLKKKNKISVSGSKYDQKSDGKERNDEKGCYKNSIDNKENDF